jgi:putative ABC transport system permease protein
MAGSWQGSIAMQTFLPDVRDALRGLTHARGFSLMAIGTLGLGIAAATTVFSLIDAVLLRPLPYATPDRLVSLHERRGAWVGPLSAHELVAARERNHVMDGIGAYVYSQSTVTGTGEPATVQTLLVTANYFDVLGIPARFGRTFMEAEDGAGANQIVVLSERFWRSRFGEDPSAIGRNILLNNVSHRVVGIMPASGDLDPDLWVPVDWPAEARRVGRHSVFAVARLKEGVSIEAARADLNNVAAALAKELPDANTGHDVDVVSLRDDVVGAAERPILVAAGAVGFLLLIACANVAHLLLTRGAARRKELAIRGALGASRGRLIRYLLVDSLILSLAGGAVGALLAAWIVDLLPAITAVDVPRIGEAAMSGRVLAAAFVCSVLTAVISGTLPALRGSRTSLTESLTERAQLSGGAPGIAGVLALSEIALALVLLIGAALMIQTVVFLMRVNPGFNARNIATAAVALPGSRYARPEQQVAFVEDLSARLRNTPQVLAVGAVSHLPLTPGDNRMGFDIAERPAGRGEERRASMRVVAGEYFRVMEIPIVRGRAFTPADARRAVPLIRWFEQQPLPAAFNEPQPPPVAMINETMARQFWPGEDPVGRRIRILFSPWIEVVGVVADVRHAGLSRDPVAEMYLSHLQEPQRGITLLVRTGGDPAAVAPMIRAGIRSLDPNLPLPAVTAMQDVVRSSIGRARFDAWLLATFAGVALLLSAIGIYGVTSYAVAQRTREIGIRAALGATRRHVLALVLGRTVWLTMVGIAAGLLCALALTRVLTSLLYGVRATDAATFIIVAGMLLGVTLLASYIPARRALRIDPLAALRTE